MSKLVHRAWPSLRRTHRQSTKIRVVSAMASRPRRILLAWDFDYSLIETNSDTLLVEHLGAGPIYQENRHMQWTLLMDKCWHWATTKGGKGPDDVLAGCRAVTVHPDVKAELLGVSRNPHIELAIASDANAVSIDTILSSNGLLEAFRGRVHTNPAEFRPDGSFRVRPYCGSLRDLEEERRSQMDENRGKVGGRGGEALDANDASDDWASRADRPAHACQVCPANVCKGDILDELLIGPDEEGPGRFDAVVYVGDGSNDVCPCTRGGGRVVAFARAKYPPDVRKSPAMHRELRRAGCREVTGAVTREALEEAGLGRGALPVLVPWESPEELAVRLREAMAALS